MGKYIIAGNWKMNKLPSETYDFVKEVAKATEGATCEVVCCTPYVCLTEAVKAAKKVVADKTTTELTQVGGGVGANVISKLIKALGIK